MLLSWKPFQRIFIVLRCKRNSFVSSFNLFIFIFEKTILDKDETSAKRTLTY